MITLRVVRRDRHEQVLAECRSSVVPEHGETLVLETLDASGVAMRPGTLWRVVSVTLHVPSSESRAPASGGALAVNLVEVAVVPDAVELPELAQAAEEIPSRSRL